MSYTFGGATGDDISSASTGGTIVANNTVNLVTGWWYPTTLTATKGYWAADAATGMRVDSTTSELSLASNRTTDAVWTSSGAGIVINQWHFIALLLTTASGTPAYRLWISNDGNLPTERTVSVTTAGSGTGTGSTTRCIGNQSSAAGAAFQGDIGQVVYISSNVVSAVLPLAVLGTITQPEADRIFNTVVLPIFLGDIPFNVKHQVTSITGTYSTFIADQESIPGLVSELNKGTNVALSHRKAPSATNATANPNVRQLGNKVDVAWTSKATPWCRR